MNPEAASQDEQFENVQEISDGGERVTHLNPDAIYHAHLSIYDFAVQFCQGAFVLDAGSGAGYGSAYLADQGARHVWGIDISAKAIAFSRYHFQKPNLTFQEMSLEQIHGFPPQHFDLIFSSNTLEHVPGVVEFLRQAWRLLKPSGTLLLAVPPITDERLQYINLINPYHINIWTPRQWAYALGLFFEEITPVLHGVEKLGADFKAEHMSSASPVTAKSFVFARGSIEAMYQTFTLTAIFVARKPRGAAEVPGSDVPLAFVDESFTRPQGYIEPALRQKLKKYFDMPAPPYILPTRATNDTFNLRRIITGALAFVSGKLCRGKE